MGETTVKTPEGRTDTESPVVTQGTAVSFFRRVRTPRRPRIWFEILLIAVSYWTYSLVRNAAPEQKSAALHNADWIWSVEHSLGLALEENVNHAVNSVTWLIVSMNYYYATLHFIMTIGVLIWLFRTHPGRYAAARLALFATTAVALVGYYLFPLAPPRLMHGTRFIDTVMVHDTWGSMASGNLKAMSNQYAAMPSMHIGWSLWCGLIIFALASAPWAKILGLLYPAVTLLVIVSTANHFWLDAVGGVLCLSFGLALSYAWYGALPHRLPRVPAGMRARGARAGGLAAPQPESSLAGPAQPAASSAAGYHRDKFTPRNSTRPAFDDNGDRGPSPVPGKGGEGNRPASGAAAPPHPSPYAP